MDIIKHETLDKKFDTPILFIHGMWHGAWHWEDFIPYFTGKGFDCYSFNLRKHGGEKRPAGVRWVGIKHYLEDLEAAISQIGNPILIGHSMGGFIIQKYLENHEPPASVLLASVPSSGTFKATMKFMLKYPLTFLKINLTMSMYWMITSKDRYEKMFMTKGTDREKNYHRLTEEAFRAYMDTMIFKLPRRRKIVDNVKNPSNILVLAGGADAFFSVKEEKKTAKRIGAEFKIFDGLGHNMHEGPGSDDVAKYAIEFIEKKLV